MAKKKGKIVVIDGHKYRYVGGGVFQSLTDFGRRIVQKGKDALDWVREKRPVSKALQAVSDFTGVGQDDLLGALRATRYGAPLASGIEWAREHGAGSVQASRQAGMQALAAMQRAKATARKMKRN